jgi:hypothetical protein
VRALKPVAAVLAGLLGVLLIVLAVNVLVVWRDVADDDFLFQSAPQRNRDLWTDVGLLPGSLTVKALGIERDLAYRRSASVFVRAQPGRRTGGNPQLQALRGQAALELTRASHADTDTRRRSRLLNFLGIVPLDQGVTAFEQRASMLQTAIGVFQSAVRTDPQNADAKVNLEIVLRDLNVTGLPPNAPSGEAAGGRRSSPGGVSGSGY